MDAIAMAQSSAQIQMQTGMQSITIEPELIQVLTVEQFIEKCLRFNDAHPGLVTLDIHKGTDCPVHIYAEEAGQKTCKQAVSGIRYCKVCGLPECPVCHSHVVEQISRVTGYIQAVSGWGNSKKQELKDRQRYNIGIGGSARNVNR